MTRLPPILLALSLAACSGGGPAAPKTPAEAFAAAGRSGPELSAASLALDAGAVLTATAAAARCPDAPCRERAALDAWEVYRPAAEALLWAAAAQAAAAKPGEPRAQGPDVEGVRKRLGLAPPAPEAP